MNFPAFPNPSGEQGMTMRDYFAAVAIPTATELMKSIPASKLNGMTAHEAMAVAAYHIADAMLKVRARE